MFFMNENLSTVHSEKEQSSMAEKCKQNFFFYIIQHTEIELQSSHEYNLECILSTGS